MNKHLKTYIFYCLGTLTSTFWYGMLIALLLYIFDGSVGKVWWLGLAVPVLFVLSVYLFNSGYLVLQKAIVADGFDKGIFVHYKLKDIRNFGVAQYKGIYQSDDGTDFTQWWYAYRHMKDVPEEIWCEGTTIRASIVRGKYKIVSNLWGAFVKSVLSAFVGLSLILCFV